MEKLKFSYFQITFGQKEAYLNPEKTYERLKKFGYDAIEITPPKERYGLKITTDDKLGKVKMYVGEGEFTNDSIDTMGGVAICKVPNLQKLMKFICKNGFEHHVAMYRSNTADVLKEALGKYLGWDIYRHS